MKLHYGPGACSMGIHLLLEEIGAPFELARLNLREGEHRRPPFSELNPKLKVPALELDDGAALTEFPAIASYLAETNPGAGLLPVDPLARARVLEMVAYVSGVPHAQGFSRFFRPENFSPDPAGHDQVKAKGLATMAEAFALIDRQWRGGDWVLPGGFSIADAALFYVEFWYAERAGQTLEGRCAAHLARVLDRPAARRMLASEGLARAA